MMTYMRLSGKRLLPTTLRLLLLLSILLSCCHTAIRAEQYSLLSPNGMLKLKVTIGEEITYSVEHNGVELVKPSNISITLRNKLTLGHHAVVESVEDEVVKGTIPLVFGKTKSLEEHYVEKRILFTERYQLILRAYDEGVAYRFRTIMGGDVVVSNEEVEVNFAGQPTVWFPTADEKMWSWERAYDYYDSIQEVPAGDFAITPTMFSYPESGVRVVVAESDLSDYPGLYLQPDGENRVVGKWANYPSKVTEPTNVYAYHRVEERYSYIAQTKGNRYYPWRLFIVTTDDRDLLTNELIFKLARPQVLQNTDWIKPGKSVWEWWHDGILEGVNPSGTLSFNSYKHYIDYAARHKIEYLTMDAGWQSSFVKEVCQYAESKGVKVILWDFINLPVANPNRLTELKNYGAAGVKVDLIERDDQIAMNWIEKLARDCADRELLLVLHGCPKPTGLHRAYPNIITYEAVRGNECAKWDKTPNADYHLQFPFIRMLAGPLDYTPGSMRNCHIDEFEPIPTGIPNSIGTRAHELAMYILFDQPMAYLCDSPIEYNKHPELSPFFEAVPTVWDETLPLLAEVGKYAVVARQKDNRWFVGGMTNSESRSLTVDFSFLPSNRIFTAKLYRDNDNTDGDAKAMTVEEMTVSCYSKITFDLAREGGFVMLFDEGSYSSIDAIAPEVHESPFSLFVDSARSQLTVATPNDPILAVSLFDSTGKCQLKRETNGIADRLLLNIANMSEGVYLARVATHKSIYTEKFMK